MIYRPDLEAALWVTPSGRHMRIGAQLRFQYTFDERHWETIPTPPVPEDPLHFSDGKPYRERLAAARKATHAQDAMAIGYGKIRGTPAGGPGAGVAFLCGSPGAGGRLGL